MGFIPTNNHNLYLLTHNWFLKQLWKLHHELSGLLIPGFLLSMIGPHLMEAKFIGRDAGEACLVPPRLGIPLLRHSHAHYAGSKCLGIRPKSPNLKRLVKMAFAQRLQAKNQTHGMN